MSVQYYNLTCNSYQQNLCCGFSNLQQKQEFVDMTLAADGYLTKVHKNIIALGSPYLKEMISSVTCDHPVIFLGNINYEILTLIIEYIYTGEVQVPMNILQSFLKAASDLQLVGLNSFSISQSSVLDNSNTMLDPVQLVEEHPPKFVTNTMPNIVVQNIYDSEAKAMDNTQNGTVDVEADISQIPFKEDIKINNLNVNNNTDLVTHEINGQNVQANITVTTDYKPQQYSVSSRGCLQLIMNRFIYLMHHTSNKGFKRRWRCSDYRRKSCKAYIDTEGDIIMKRTNTHNHPYHDDKILKKVKQNLIYGSIKSIEIDKQERNIKLNTTVNDIE